MRLEFRHAHRHQPMNMQANMTRARRPNGREARRAARLARGSHVAVHPGQPGGAYKPLSEAAIKRIYATALDVLENIGMGSPIPEILRYALPKGCTLGEDGRLRFPRALVEDMIAVSAKEYLLYALDPGNDHMVRGRLPAALR